jgi:hypothetical protein
MVLGAKTTNGVGISIQEIINNSENQLDLYAKSTSGVFFYRYRKLSTAGKTNWFYTQK